MSTETESRLFYQTNLLIARSLPITLESTDPRHEISNKMVCATIKDTDQPRIRAVWLETLQVWLKPRIQAVWLEPLLFACIFYNCYATNSTAFWCF